MLLLVYSSKPTSWQPDRSLQQHRALSLVYKLPLYLPFSPLSPWYKPQTEYKEVQAYIARSASHVLPGVLILFIFPHYCTQTSDITLCFSSTSPSSLLFLVSELKISLQGLELDSQWYQECIEAVSVEAPCCVPRYSGFITASSLGNVKETLCFHALSLNIQMAEICFGYSNMTASIRVSKYS